MEQWQIWYKGRGLSVSVGVLGPGAEALRGFRDACDKGNPGRYELRAGALVLATGKVKRDEMAITWKRGRVFYALGVTGKVLEISKVERFFAAEGS